MSLHTIYLIILLFWPFTETILMAVKRAKGDMYEVKDRHSLLLIWLTIIASLIAAVYCKKFTFAIIPLSDAIEAPVVIFIIVAGMVLRWVSILTLGRFFTANVSIADNHRLVTKGIYHYLRHPSYTGVLISFAGIAITFRNWLSFIACFIPVLLVLLYRIRVEEQVLLNHFGNIYMEYKKHTKCLLPYIY